MKGTTSTTTLSALTFAERFDSAKRARFAAALDSLNKAGDSIAADVIEAHADGSESAILALVSAIKLCKRSFDAPAINALRVAAARGRKKHAHAKFTLSISSAGDLYQFSPVRVADIQRASGAGRKSSKPAPAASTPAVDSAALDSANATIERQTSIVERYAAALRALGVSDADLRSLASGRLAPDALRLDKPRPVVTPRQSRSAALASVNAPVAASA